MIAALAVGAAHCPKPQPAIIVQRHDDVGAVYRPVVIPVELPGFEGDGCEGWIEHGHAVPRPAVNPAGRIDRDGVDQLAAILAPAGRAAANDGREFAGRIELVDLVGVGLRVEVALGVAGEALAVGDGLLQRDRRDCIAGGVDDLKLRGGHGLVLLDRGRRDNHLLRAVDLAHDHRGSAGDRIVLQQFPGRIIFPQQPGPWLRDVDIALRVHGDALRQVVLAERLILHRELRDELAAGVELLHEQIADPDLLPILLLQPPAIQHIELVPGVECDVAQLEELAIALARAADLDVGAFAGAAFSARY